MKLILTLYLFLLSFSMEAEALTVTTKNASHQFYVEIAKTSLEKANGLMNRTEMAEKNGMIFLWNNPQHLSFWMKNTLIPLDIIFIRKDGTIAKIHKSCEIRSLNSRPSGCPCQAALELNGGSCDKFGIKEGDYVSSESLKSVGIHK
ncbi:uncharacterized protein MONOS_2920 [Monocercomonoides exilis]|uniref:uncharacterized protein n=1 Tax=Monocercomonoides exilis TaxID=2049356 RepID=UPI003559D346|nr:hypothetical protein MONOS_2920 [Monocercomonoides exilis]|eukprot:MONOS_2920.1-p1 / transcript=MONOS_2920.1 / gene=MONOS_2920 / organism=Monocercomonoides_exilis_PA203 / gene_product=exported protein / transcript_product=exported protein / location=Mono_scaffold00064:12448-12996(+) / protein_length=146 / sequence_SO=supercontig / SO=protein_coding / is_pseudo=false